VDIEKANERRIALIGHKFSRGLSPTEDAELQALSHIVDAAWPRYTTADYALLEKAEKLIREARQ